MLKIPFKNWYRIIVYFYDLSVRDIIITKIHSASIHYYPWQNVKI